MGRPQYQDVREFANLKGYALTPKFVFIDGRTGAQLYSESFYEEALYSESQNTPALSSYFELMDKLLPGVPEHPEHPEDPGHPGPAGQVGRPMQAECRAGLQLRRAAPGLKARPTLRRLC